MGAVTLGEVLADLERIGLDKDEAAFRTLVTRYLQSLGFDNYVFGFLSPPEGMDAPYFISNYPEEWVARYVGEGYLAEDVVVQQSSRSVVPFSWTSVRADDTLTPKQKRVFTEARHHGLKSGGAVPVHGPGGMVACLSVASRMEEQEFEKVWARTRAELMAFAAFAFENVLQRLLGEGPGEQPRLPRRVRECLLWAARGKTAKETADILSISEETVVSYLKVANEKLGVTSRTQAVAKAVSFGLIIP